MHAGYVDLLQPITLHGPEGYAGAMTDRKVLIMPSVILCARCGARAGSRSALN